MELADYDGAAAKRTRLDDGVVYRERTPAHNTTDSGSQSARSNYCAMRIKNKRTRQRARSTSLTTRGQATDAFGEVATMDYDKIGRENRHHDSDNCRPSQQHTHDN
jgi:hypothetical protein